MPTKPNRNPITHLLLVLGAALFLASAWFSHEWGARSPPRPSATRPAAPRRPAATAGEHRRSLFSSAPAPFGEEQQVIVAPARARKSAEPRPEPEYPTLEETQAFEAARTTSLPGWQATVSEALSDCVGRSGLAEQVEPAARPTFTLALLFTRDLRSPELPTFTPRLLRVDKSNDVTPAPGIEEVRDCFARMPPLALEARTANTSIVQETFSENLIVSL